VTTPDDPHDAENEVPQGDDEQEDRLAILARRALFVASAVAGIGAAVGCGDDLPPQPCLTVAVDTTASAETTAAPATTEAPPQPCLTMMPADTADPVPPRDAGPPKPPPRPCLTVTVPSPPPPDAGPPKPPPHPCLTPRRP
jgi:hypothetical protein